MHPEGTYDAIVEFARVGTVGKNGLAAVRIQYKTEHGTITGTMFLERRDGTMNEFAVRSLREVLGWTSDDPYDIESFSNIECSIVVEHRIDDKGKPHAEVKYLNSRGQTSGMKTGDDVRNDVRSRLSGGLRALFGAGSTHVSPSSAAPPPQKHTIHTAWEWFERMHPNDTKAKWEKAQLDYAHERGHSVADWSDFVAWNELPF